MFEQDQKIKALFWENNEQCLSDEDTDIKIVIIDGQMAGVPWALVTTKKGELSKKREILWNLAKCTGVELFVDK